MTHKEKIKLINPIFRQILGNLGYIAGIIEHCIYDYENENEMFCSEDLVGLQNTLTQTKETMLDKWEELRKEDA